MVETIEEARQPVTKVDNDSYIGAKTAMYGVEATLPKASGGTSDSVFAETTPEFMHLIIVLKSMSKRLQKCRTVFHL
jgi:hypothetical protein